MITLTFQCGCPVDIGNNANTGAFLASIVTQAAIAQPSVSDMSLAFNSQPDNNTVNLDHSRTPTPPELTAIQNAAWSPQLMTAISLS